MSVAANIAQRLSRAHWALRTAGPGGPLTTVATLFGIFATVVTLQMTGALRPVNDAMAGLGFELVQRPASQTLTVVEIDAASVRAAGQWPWDRERYAHAIRNLQNAGAEVVAFDVDFSAASNATSDGTLRAAIERRPGSVVLPTFVQSASDAARDGVIENSPLKSLADQALLASVNVPVDDDGRVRRYQYGFGEGNSHRASIGALLANGAPGRTGSFLVDYGIRAETVPHLSFQDVYAGRFNPAQVRGHKVLVGATALELGDEFATPLRGTLNGVYLHALAYESLRARRDLHLVNPLILMGLGVWVAWWLRARATTDLSSPLRRHLTVAAFAILGPVVLHALAPVVVETAPILGIQLLCLVWTLRMELRRRAEAIVREREAGLLHLALHDPESELPNRRALLKDTAARALAAPNRPLAMVAVGIDRFAALRGAIGYHRFHEVVRQVSARIRETSGEPLVTHLSTSVIGVTLSAATTVGLMAKVREIEALDPWLSIEGLSVDAFVRIGVAYRAGADDTAEVLLENASIALDRAREMDRRVVSFDAGAFADPSLNIALMSDMLRGLESGELEMHYQPKIAAASGAIVGAEALVRWAHPTRGQISPDNFIATAEETGMIRALTEWSVGEVVAALKLLRAAGHDLTLAVNISAGLLADRDFRAKLLALSAGCEGGLCLEVTESAIIRNPDEAMAAIAHYRAAGLKISIDDYGSGLSSLAYLKMIHADELKIDKSLVACVHESARDQVILKSAIDLSHSLGMSVVAEGVETDEVLAAVRDLGCDVAQGWLISKALPFPDFLALVRRGTSPQANRTSVPCVHNLEVRWEAKRTNSRSG